MRLFKLQACMRRTGSDFRIDTEHAYASVTMLADSGSHTHTCSPALSSIQNAFLQTCLRNEDFDLTRSHFILTPRRYAMLDMVTAVIRLRNCLLSCAEVKPCFRATDSNKRTRGICSATVSCGRTACIIQCCTVTSKRTPQKMVRLHHDSG